MKVSSPEKKTLVALKILIFNSKVIKIIKGNMGRYSGVELHSNVAGRHASPRS